MTVYLEDGRKVRELQAQVASLEGEAQRLREELRKEAFRYRCESIVNLELIDLCRKHGIRYRPSLAARPWEDDASMPPEGGINTRGPPGPP